MKTLLREASPLSNDAGILRGPASISIIYYNFVLFYGFCIPPLISLYVIMK